MIIPFDILYEGFCNRLRSSGKSDSILKLIKKENSDCFRIKVLLEEEPDLYSLLERNINESYERKDEIIAKKLWKRGVEGKSAELLTEAISYCPIPPNFQEKIEAAFDQNAVKSLLSNFMESSLQENCSPENMETGHQLMCSLLFDRGSIFLNAKRFVSALKDFMRAWLLGFCKTLALGYQVAICFCEIGELDMSKELLQCCAQHLRTLTMENEEKSVWTMNIVKILKAIEALKKQKSQQKKSQESKIHILLSTQLSSHDSPCNSNFCNLYGGESECLRGTSKALELKYSLEKGRHMVAKQRIPPGSTIIAENPYAWAISKVNYHKFCTWCMQRVDAGIPCKTCASAVFCGVSCRDQATAAFHGKECRILKLLDSSQKLGNMALLCFRTILTTPLSTMQEFTKALKNDIPHQLAMGLDDKNKFDSSSYLSVFSQTPNSEQRQAADLLKRTFSAVYLALCLKHIGYLDASGAGPKEDNGLSEQERDIAAVILRNLQSASCNAYGINNIVKKINYEEGNDKNLEIDEIGGATYPIISTTNHSCSPNAYRINVPGRMCLVKTIREISQGEEIFDCYGPLYLMEPRQERIAKLQAQYLFRCSCPSCTEDWPSYSKLRQQLVQYKCSSCHCALNLKVDGKHANFANSKFKCPYCDKVTDMKKLRESLSTHKERFGLAKTSILAEVFQPFDQDMEKIICEYLGLCQTAYMDPCFDLVEGQEVLKLFWNLSIRNS